MYHYNNKPKEYCSICKWNETHLTAYHEAFEEQGDKFDMCTEDPDHLFSMALSLLGPTQRQQEHQSPPSLFKAKLTETFNDFEQNVIDDTDKAHVQGIKKTLFSYLK